MVDMTDWYDDFIREEKTDEKIVELTDIVEERKEPLKQEDIIELKDIVKEDNSVLDMDNIKEEGLKPEENLEPEDDIYFNEGPVLENEEPVLEMDEPAEEIILEPDMAVATGQELNVTREQLEAALERVIEKKFADKIEILLFESMEKVIKKEIVEIKERLQKDLDKMENV